MVYLKIIKLLTLSLILILIIVSLFIFGINNEKNVVLSDLPLKNRLIFIDPGHGGVDPGAIYKNIKESDLNLEISLKLARVLEESGATVFLTRDGDYDLSNGSYSRKRTDFINRCNLINNSFADIFLSIHLNSTTTTSWHGAQVFYDDVNELNSKLANILQSTLNAELKGRREAKEIYSLYMYRNIDIPGVLLEVGFLSNPNDRYLLQKESYQEQLTIIITKGVIKYFEK